MKFKKGIGAIIGVSLLIIVSVVSIIGFQVWYNNYQSGINSDVETKSDSGAISTMVETVENEELYFKNNYNENLSILSVEIGGVDCNVTRNISKGMKNFSVSSCIENFSNTIQDVVVVTNKGIFSKKILFGQISQSIVYLSFIETNDSHFNSGTVTNLTVTGTGISGSLILEMTGGDLVTAFDSNGWFLNSPTSGQERTYGVEIDGDYLYLVGVFDSNPSEYWFIEKRNKTDGSLINSFGTNGLITVDKCCGGDFAMTVLVDGDYLYVGGGDGSSNDYMRLEKRNKSDGSLVTSFNTDGIYEVAHGTSSSQIYDIQIDDDFIYFVGATNINDPQSNDQSQVFERINKTDGSLNYSYTYNRQGDEAEYWSLALDENYVYIGGHDETTATNDVGWRIEKRYKSNGSLVNSFGTSGVVIQNPTGSSTDYLQSLVIDDTYIYLGGNDIGSNMDWRIEKRYKSNGSLVTGFDSDGIVRHQLSTSADIINDMILDGETLYVTGKGNTLMYIQARDKTDGSLLSEFGGSGSVPFLGGSTYGNAIDLDDDSLYVGLGYTTYGIAKYSKIGYLSSGNFTSQVLDTGSTSTLFSTVSYVTLVPIGTTLSVNVGVGNISTPDGSWVWKNGVASGGDISDMRGRYVQYKTFFTTTNVSSTSQLDSITINYN